MDEMMPGLQGSGIISPLDDWVSTRFAGSQAHPLRSLDLLALARRKRRASSDVGARY